MGSRGAKFHREEPVHGVTISEGFWLGQTPVTQAQWRAVMGDLTKAEYQRLAVSINPALERSDPPQNIGSPSHFEDDNRPVEHVSWVDALVFCARAEELELAPAGWRVTLPTEAQWEYACRAGTETEYHSGDGEAALAKAGWYGEDWDEGGTHSVGEKNANRWGLHDMHGNVWEWCLDRSDDDTYARRDDGAVDPFVPGTTDAQRVQRGGSWIDGPVNCRASYRFWGLPVDRNWFDGFRVCLVRSSAWRQPVKTG